MTSVPAAVLFDFSGTLFRFEAASEWFDGLVDADGAPVHADLQAELIRRMTQPVGVPAAVADDDRTAWERRDLDPAEHRRAYLAVLRASGLRAPGDAEALYQRLLDPHSWQPFSDTASVLGGLAGAHVPVGVVSNVAFDVRDVFALHGLDEMVGTYALSYEVGAIKPDPRLFRAALDRLGVDGADALMVGDSDVADGGARSVGAAFERVDDAPRTQRPDALLSAVRAHGLLTG